MNEPTPTRGLALPTLLLMLTLASLATLLALRNLWLNEHMLNAEADWLRTQQHAEAILPVALADILSATGSRHTVGNATQTHAFFPNSMNDYDVLRQRLGTAPCLNGICAPQTLQDTATQASYWQTQTATAMPVDASDTPYGDHVAWYWVEVFPQTTVDSFVYRITVLTQGVLPNTRTVLQTIWVRNPTMLPTGQWRSWHVLHN
jgi:Tfp pilus assembly protein PilX